eukprot:scaffold160150_cov16-Prasinocladus_malaysianus.AAC.1
MLAQGKIREWWWPEGRPPTIFAPLGVDARPVSGKKRLIYDHNLPESGNWTRHRSAWQRFSDRWRTSPKLWRRGMTTRCGLLVHVAPHEVAAGDASAIGIRCCECNA